jgi:hypothetical protein
MTERAVILGIALLVVAVALAGMASMHDQHYRKRRWQLLEARVGTLERIIIGDHD